MAETKNTFGKLFKERRMALGLTLREFCHQNGLDAGNLSRLERGLAPPPQGERLGDYAEMLGLDEGSDEWYEFFDLAAAERGRIPEDLQTEDVVEKLPILFRTLRGQRVPDDKLDELVKLVKGKRKR
jgi:transcriptional regulator with XRE-family HTH domain